MELQSVPFFALVVDNSQTFVTIQLVSAVKRSLPESTFRSFTAGVLPASEASATSAHPAPGRGRSREKH